MKKLSLSALAAVGVLAGMTSVNAADLGGNCCADLEERIAELEATTVRKGNRKVSLTVSGWVSQQVTYWDDGVEKNAYVSDIGSTLNSNFKLLGSAKISPDLTAGYLMQIEVVGNENLLLNQNKSAGNTPIANGKGLDVIQSFWFLKSESLGKLSVGTQSSAADNAALLPDGSGSLIFANYIMYDINGFNLRKGGALVAGQTWGGYATCQAFGPGALGLGMDCDGVPNNVVRYDTPTFGGFSASASWGEDDIGAVSARYAGEFSGFKLAAAVGYFETTNDQGDLAVRARGGKKASALQIGAYVQNIPTGLFVYGAYGKDYNDVTGGLGVSGANFGKQQVGADNYYIKAGIRQKWSPLGATVVYGEYGKNEDKMTNANWIAGTTSTNLTQYGVGIVQEIDAAAMSLFLNYRHYSADATCAAGVVGCAGAGTVAGKNSFDDAQLVKAGAIINF
jgi:hypothetical protein